MAKEEILEKCRDCDGTGTICDDLDGLNRPSIETCERCKGTGKAKKRSPTTIQVKACSFELETDGERCPFCNEEIENRVTESSVDSFTCRGCGAKIEIGFQMIFTRKMEPWTCKNGHKSEDENFPNNCDICGELREGVPLVPPAKVCVFSNGMVMAFDSNGKQMPHLQGPIAEANPKICATGFDMSTAKTAEW